MAASMWASLRGRRAKVLPLVGLCVLLAACAHTSAAVTKGVTPTSTVYSTKGRGIPTATATPALPYSFPKQWRLDDGLTANVMSFTFMPTNPMVGFACAASTQAPNTTELYATHDGGATWSLVVNAPASNPAIPYAGCAVFPDQTNERDLFLTVQDASAPQDTHGVGRLYRSQDGGATWQKLALVLPGTWYGPNTLAVSGSRILVTVAPGGEQNPLPNYLYASGDGGQTWKSVAPDLNGQALTVNAEMSEMGGTVFVSASAPSPGGAGAARPVAAHAQSLTRPRSSGTPAPITYWKTSDGGVTWSQVQLPGDLPIFVQSGDGSGYFGVSLNQPRDPSGNYVTNGPVTPYASMDGGATWKALPTFAGVENGYLDPAQLGENGRFTISPSGEIIAAARHSTSTSSDDAGLFAIRGGDATPAWQPLAPGGVAPSGGPQTLQAVVQNGRIQLWGLLDNGYGNGTLASMSLN